MYTDKLFTGQREMAGLGIYHYGARFYSPKLGRFLSADTIVPGYANPQNLNRFSYVRNNPLRYTDPTGHLIDEGCGCANTGTYQRPIITVVAGRRTTNSDRGRTFVLQQEPLELPAVIPTDDDNNGGGGLEPSPLPVTDADGGPITNCIPNQSGGFDECLVNIPVAQAQELYNGLLLDYYIPLGGVAVVWPLVASWLAGRIGNSAILITVALIVSIPVVDLYASAEIVQISQIGNELNDGLDNQNPGQSYIPFEVSRATADSPIQIGWTGGSNSQTIHTPIAQNIILDLIGLSP